MAFNYSPKIVTDGLVLYLDAANTRSYPGSGTTWSDLSRGGNNGTLTNGPTFNSGNGGSIVFDGSNDYVATNLGTLRSLTGTRSTLNIWFRTINSSARQVLLADWDSSGAQETARLEVSGFNISSNRVGGTINGVSNSTPVQSTTSIQNNTWYWVTILYNGTNTQLYLNGQLEQSLVTTERGSDSTGNVVIGRAGNFNAFYWNGNIAQIQIYNRALSATEILQNYNATKTRFGL
jgi:hypothetical protein